MAPFQQWHPLPAGFLKPGTVLIVGGAATFIPPRPARVEAPARRARVAGLVSARDAARRLGIGRSSTLPRLVAARLLVPVPRGQGQGFRAADVERLIEHGYKLPAESGRSRKARAPRPTKVSPLTAKRISDLPY
jgi:hypothetical protein